MTDPSHYDGDPLLTVRFTPESIRAHFSGQEDAEDVLSNISDESLAEAARRVVPTETQLSDAIFSTFESVLDAAAHVEQARRN